MTKAAVEAVDLVYRPGFKYSKAKVLVVRLCQKGDYTDDLFSVSQPEATEKVMGVLDAINGRWGRGGTACCQRAHRSGLGDASQDDDLELHDACGSNLDCLL